MSYVYQVIGCAAIGAIIGICVACLINFIFDIFTR
jgi:hypothetical protein